MTEQIDKKNKEKEILFVQITSYVTLFLELKGILLHENKQQIHDEQFRNRKV